MTRTLVLSLATLLAVVSHTWAEDLPMSTVSSADPFYTRPALFSFRPSSTPKDQGVLVQSVNRFGPVGIGIELHLPAFIMKVKNVEKGSPAEATGHLKAGQFIDTINGQKLKDIDPRIQLGSIITQAEATDGKVILSVREKINGATKEVTVNIPVLGAYSKSWPLNCPKSATIVRNLAARFASEGCDGFGGDKMLFMLSTGEEKDLEVVRSWIPQIIKRNASFGKKGPAYQWHVMNAPALAEYYLRTGDGSVLPLMQQIADAVKLTQYHDGWGGRGLSGHHMGIAGTPTCTFLLLAKQCGVDVDDDMLQSSLQHYYRFAGRGVNPYMDARPENTFTDNGRVGKLAFMLAAASHLRPEGEQSLYARARDNSAMKSFYSTSYMLHGHTGGGIGEVWRSAAMGLMVEKMPHHYQEFMEKRSWFYELSRRFDGSFGILDGGERYDDTTWGAAMGLTFTAPRKMLSIFGAPRSKHAKNTDSIPKRCWGTAADDAFYAIAPNGGSPRSLDAETVDSDTGLAVDRILGKPEVGDETILKYIRHPEHRFREQAANAIHDHGRYHLLAGLLQHKDPRVRNAGVMAIHPPVTQRGVTTPGTSREHLTPAIISQLLEMLKDPEESWFTVDKILCRAFLFTPAELAPYLDRIEYFMAHDEWWLRHAALEALFPLARDKSTYLKALAVMERHLPSFIRRTWPLYGHAKALKEADPAIQKANHEVLGKVYLAHPGRRPNPRGGLHPMSRTWFLETIGYAIAEIPGGLNTLYKVSRERFPEQALKHQDRFLNHPDLASYTGELKNAISDTILKQLIPSYIADNRKLLIQEAENETSYQWEFNYREPRMEKLAGFYNHAGIEDYDWSTLPPEASAIPWRYHSFDPPEQKDWGGHRYRTVTVPAGMEGWSSVDFDAKKAGWSEGRAPFGQKNGTLVTTPGSCTLSFCRCGDAMNTLWEKEVLLLQARVTFPAFREGYRYRLVVGGMSHVNRGEGFDIYCNGKKIFSRNRGVGRREGAQPICQYLDKSLWSEFSGKETVISAMSFLKHNFKTSKPQRHFSIWIEEMKIPPLDRKVILNSAMVSAMKTSAWQSQQDPDRTIDNPEEGKFQWDGTFPANKEFQGNWLQVGTVASIEDFSPKSSLGKGRMPEELTLKPKGETNDLLLYHTGDHLMNLDSNEALQMVLKTIEGKDYLFVEAGGFSVKHKAGWKCQVEVYRRK